jgi:ribosomal protein S4
MLERRLQTIVYRKGIAQTPGQARQIITHGQVVVEERIVTVPKYQVSLAEENSVRLKEGFKLPEIGKKQAPVESEVKEKESEKESSEGVSVGKEA